MKVIAFCGIDGAGKTTQMDRAAEALAREGKRVCRSKVAYYPFHLYQSEEITQLDLRIGMGFAFARHYRERLPEWEREGVDYVLCDRHALCHLAFAGTYGVDREGIRKLEAIFGLGGEPDLTFYFDVPLTEALRRIGSRTEKPADSDETPEILGETQKHYEELLQEERFGKVIRVDAMLSAEEQTRQIMEKIWEKERV